MIEVTTHIIVTPEFGRYSWNREQVMGARVTAARARPPENMGRGAVAVKVTLNIPDEAFLPLRPVAVIDVPVEHTQVIVAKTETPAQVSEEVVSE